MNAQGNAGKNRRLALLVFLEYARDYWSMQEITGVCKGLLEYVQDYLSMSGHCMSGPIGDRYNTGWEK